MGMMDMMMVFSKGQVAFDEPELAYRPKLYFGKSVLAHFKFLTSLLLPCLRSTSNNTQHHLHQRL
jgi:hypothetical protein